jgi:hypothetical protein
MTLRRFVSIAVALLLALAPAAAMTNPGVLLLGDFQVGAPATQVGTPITSLAGLNALSLQVRLAGGTGGSKINVYVQTSLDQGQSWFDIANIAFANTPGVEVVNLSGLDKLTTPTAPVYLQLADNTVLDGPIGDRLQAVVVSTGTYTGNTLISVRGVAR